MVVVLGIDAAWTPHKPSGLALVVKRGSEWSLVALSPSYDHFSATARGEPPVGRPSGSLPNVPQLLTACESIAGSSVTLVAIDMPLALQPINGRRESDDAVSRRYGARGAGTHTPNANRPGPISSMIRNDFLLAGYALQLKQPVSGGLIEVYPHPAIIEFAGLLKRSPYKYANMRKYWKEASLHERQENLLNEWKLIANAVTFLVPNAASVMDEFFHQTASAWEWKAQEDMLDAIICAAVGICALDGTGVPFGDETSAIWVPKVRD